jgi:ornithine cyclodeaminase/alanine dehydrogenase-like protein (mu-crystallin family)
VVRAAVTLPLFLDAAAIHAACPPEAAVAAVEAALRGGLDPTAEPPRTVVQAANGQFLLMASEAAETSAGVKVVTVAPGNPTRGLPRVQAAYLHFDRDTLALTALLDGTALTTLRTPAVSVAAIRAHLPERPVELVVIGAGPQATGHVLTLAAVRPLAGVVYLVRDPSRVTLDAHVLPLGSTEADAALGAADVVVCATSARTPLFDSMLLRPEVIVVAVGSHEPDARELDSALLARSSVVVEDTATALREAGDVVLAMADGSVTADDLIPMRNLLTGAAIPAPDRPLVVKTVGMSWEDVVVAEAVVSAARPRAGPRRPS